MAKLTIFEMRNYCAIKKKISALENKIYTLDLDMETERNIMTQIHRLEISEWIRLIERRKCCSKLKT